MHGADCKKEYMVNHVTKYIREFGSKFGLNAVMVVNMNFVTDVVKQSSECISIYIGEDPSTAEALIFNE